MAFGLRRSGLDLNLRSAFLHATIQLGVALPAAADPLPIHHEGGAIRQ